MKIAIVAVGYNRPDSIETLLESVSSAEYKGDTVDLIVSIDKGDNQKSVIEIANKVKWIYGEKIVRAFDKRQGLRSHIIQCGDLTEKYDAVVVLEDDLIVSPYFYSYIKQSINFYKGEKKIAGISLYKHQMHPGVNMPFDAANNGYDVYLQQYAMSWGQCWTREMWASFKKWYKENEDTDLSKGQSLPRYIANWNKQSWLKYYMKYILETDKYFVYPYFSLSTNASDVGEHCKIPNNDYQVAMQEGDRNYNFPKFCEAIKYDIFFERIGIENIVYTKLDGEKGLNLYGNRHNFNGFRYVLSTVPMPYKLIDEIQLRYRPIEVNCINPSAGKGIYVYDLKESDSLFKSDSRVLTRYYTKSMHWKKLLSLGIYGLKNAIMNRINMRKK